MCIRDRLTDGDLMYLVYQEKVYIYQYESTQIIQSDDWNPIALSLIHIWKAKRN